jgi:cytochrome c-type biogenesis protein CcmH/NrfG
MTSQKKLDEVYDLYLAALMGAALTESLKNHYQATINYLDEALTLKPQSAEIQNNLSHAYLAYGTYLLNKEQVDEALEAFDGARKLSPDNPAIFMGLAEAFLIKGETLQAIRAVQKTLDLDPENKGALLLFRSISRK